MKKKKLVRERFRTEVFTRDKYKCKVCNASSDSLDAHHITDRHEMPNGGYVKENGITLCPDCHVMAEEFHISKGERWFYSYLPTDLYVLIGSSVEKAAKASQKL
jgi:5-methylcytosine-specific restriction endonuclease McrA